MMNFGTLGTYTFNNAEAAFQATKVTDINTLNRMQKMTGDDAFNAKPKGPSTYGKYGTNVKAMDAVLNVKFAIPALKKALLATGDAFLLEHNEVSGRDKFWSDNYDGTGANALGWLLMRIRNRLNPQQTEYMWLENLPVKTQGSGQNFKQWIDNQRWKDTVQAAATYVKAHAKDLKSLLPHQPASKASASKPSAKPTASSAAHAAFSNDQHINVSNECQTFASLTKNQMPLAPYWTAGKGKAPIKDNEIVMYAARPLPSNGTTQDTMFKLLQGRYEYAPNGAYVNFANKRLGGGVLKSGFVQEEIGIFESNLLPWLHSLSEDQDIYHRDLSVAPLVLKIIHLFQLKKNFYAHQGREKLLKILPTNTEAWADATELRIPIFWVCMAAVSLKNVEQTSSNLQKIFKQMLHCATKAFVQTALLLREAGRPLAINTGNWGAGDFKHEVPVVCILQLAAAARASKLVGPIELRYHAYDESNYRLLRAMAPQLYSKDLAHLSDDGTANLLETLHRATQKQKKGSELGSRLAVLLANFMSGAKTYKPQSPFDTTSS